MPMHSTCTTLLFSTSHCTYRTRTSGQKSGAAPRMPGTAPQAPGQRTASSTYHSTAPPDTSPKHELIPSRRAASCFLHHLHASVHPKLPPQNTLARPASVTTASIHRSRRLTLLKPRLATVALHASPGSTARATDAFPQHRCAFPRFFARSFLPPGYRPAKDPDPTARSCATGVTAALQGLGHLQCHLGLRS